MAFELSRDPKCIEFIKMKMQAVRERERGGGPHVGVGLPKVPHLDLVPD